MNVIELTAPQVEPVSLEDIYLHLHLDTDGSPPEHPHDELLRSLIKASRTKAEQTTRRVFVERTLRLVVSSFPRMNIMFGSRFGDEDDYETRPSYIELPNPPYRSIVQVQYYDLNNSLQVLSPSQYFVSDQTIVARLECAEGYVWPETYRRGDAVLIDYVAGYPPLGSPGDLAGNVPAGIKEAIKMLVQSQYDNLPPDDRRLLLDAVTSLLAGYRIYRFE